MVVPLLTGIKVVDLTSIILGPFTSQILADLGAEVIKVEPIEGELARGIHPAKTPGMSAMFISNNRNKKSLAVNLKTPQGKAVFSRLVARCDVFLHNMRVEAVTRLGFGFTEAKKLNPKIIYCSSVGFGEDGPYKGRPAYDDVIQAASGLAALPLKMGGMPAYIPSTVADKVASLYAAYGILAAVVSRARGNTEAIEVETPMFESLVSFIMNEHLAAATFSDVPEGAGYHRVLSLNRRPYQTKDGWIAALPYSGDQWRRVLQEMKRDDVIAMEWFATDGGRSRNADFLYSVLAESMPARTTAEWLETFERLDVPYSKVNGLDDLLKDPHLNNVGFFDIGEAGATGAKRTVPQPVIYRGMERGPDAPAPLLGQDTRDVLKLAGYDEAEIENLVKQGAVGVPKI